MEDENERVLCIWKSQADNKICVIYCKTSYWWPLRSRMAVMCLTDLTSSPWTHKAHWLNAQSLINQSCNYKQIIYFVVSLNKLFIFILCVHMSDECIFVHHMCAGTQGSQKRMLDPLQQELQIFVGFLIWVLRPEPVSSEWYIFLTHISSSLFCFMGLDDFDILFFICSFVWGLRVLCISCWPWTLCIVKDNPEFLIYLLLYLDFWDFSCVPPHPFLVVVGNQTRGLCAC